jgi:hypothetical protein
MQTWSITLYGPAGVISTVDTGESQFVIGTETASDVFTVHGEGVTERHAWVWIGVTQLFFCKFKWVERAVRRLGIEIRGSC